MAAARFHNSGFAFLVWMLPVLEKRSLELRSIKQCEYPV